MEALNYLKKGAAPIVYHFKDLVKKIDFDIDQDYIEFIKKHNGAEGFLSEDHYLLLWVIEDLIALNPYYEHEPKAQDLFFFGSNGSNLGYAFHKKTGKIVSIDFLEMDSTDSKVIASSFKQFINKLLE